MAHVKSESRKGVFPEHMKSKRVSKDCIIPELSVLFDFDKMCDANKTVSLGELLECFDFLTDAFITHEWGENKANHFFAMKINDFLKAKGLVTWFDEEKMEGNVKLKMTRGIDNAQAVLVCISPRYMQKVSGDNAGDNCKLEFDYASLRKTGSKMLGAVVDPTARDPTKWTGPVGMVLGPQIYVDLSDPSLFEVKMNEVYDRLLAIIKVPVSVRIAEQLQKFQEMNLIGLTDVSPSTTVFTTAGEGAGGGRITAGDDEDYESRGKFKKWFIEIGLLSKSAVRYANDLVDANVGSLDRLKKKLAKNPRFLSQLEFDEDDVDEILIKLSLGGTIEESSNAAVAGKAGPFEETASSTDGGGVIAARGPSASTFKTSAEKEAVEIRARAEREAAEIKAKADSDAGIREAAEIRARAEREAVEIIARANQEVKDRKAKADSDEENAQSSITLDRGAGRIGSGSAGKAPGQFNFPIGTVLVPPSRDYPGGLVIVVDCFNNQVKVLIATTCQLFRTLGTGVGGNGADQFSCPHFAAVHLSENLLYISDSNNDRVQVYSLVTWTLVKSFSSGFRYPAGVAVFQDLLYVSNNNSYSVKVLDRMTGEHRLTIDNDDDERRCGSSRQIHTPQGIAVHSQEGRILLYLAECGSHRIQVFDASTGQHVRMIGDGYGSRPGQFMFPCGIALAKANAKYPGRDGVLYVAEINGGKRVQVFDVTSGRCLGVLAGSQGKQSYDVAVCSDSQGRNLVFVSDSTNHNVDIVVDA